LWKYRAEVGALQARREEMVGSPLLPFSGWIEREELDGKKPPEA